MEDAEENAAGPAIMPSRTAYDFFVQSVREAYRKQSRLSSPSSDEAAFPPDLDRRIAARWDLIDSKARAGYERMAADDRARHETEVERMKVRKRGRDFDSDGTARRQLDLSVVTADDCPDLEPELRISVEDTSTLAEVLRHLQSLAAGSEWTATSGRPEDGGGDYGLELVGLIVGRRRRRRCKSSSPAVEVEAGSEVEVEESSCSNQRRRRADNDSLSETGKRGKEASLEPSSDGWTRPFGELDEGNAGVGTLKMEIQEDGSPDGGEGQPVEEVPQSELAPLPDRCEEEGQDFDADERAEGNEGGVTTKVAATTTTQPDAKAGGAGHKRGGFAQSEADNDAPPLPPLKRRKEQQERRPFDDYLVELRSYKERHGHCDVPMKHPTLGNWVKRIRMCYKFFEAGKDDSAPSYCRGLLTYSRVGALTALGFRWVVREQKERETFEERLQKYIQLKEEAGGEDQNIEDKSMRCWMSHMRRQYWLFLKGRPAETNEGRIAALERAGFAWKVHNKNFENRFEELRQFKGKFGHIRVDEKQNKRLHSFVRQCRNNYKLLKQGKPSSLTWERIKLLSDLGVVFENILAEGNHETIMKEFRHFKEENGHLNISLTHPTLGKWVHNLRVRYRLLQQGKPSTLTAEHIKDLEGLGFAFAGSQGLQFHFQQKFEDKIQALIRHKEETGDCEGHPQLGHWIREMRRRYKVWKEGSRALSGRSEEQFKRLAEIGVDLEFQPEPRNIKTFEERLEELREYRALQGHLDVRCSSTDSNVWNLYQFIVRVRKQYVDWREGRSSKLTSEQVEQLYYLGLSLEKP